MKKIGLCALFALATLSVAPVMAADNALNTAVAYAAPNSGADIQDISTAVYYAVQENTDAADVVFSTVIACRTNWSAGEVYSILRSVILAHPELEQQYRDNPDMLQNKVGVKPDSALGKLQAALDSAELSDEVVSSVMTAMQTSAVGVTASTESMMRTRTAAPRAAATSTSTRPTPSRPGGLRPTPPAMSPQR